MRYEAAGGVYFLFLFDDNALYVPRHFAVVGGTVGDADEQQRSAEERQSDFHYSTCSFGNTPVLTERS